MKNQKNLTAREVFYSLQMWEGDYRCLVPYSDKDPTKWKTYEMHDYRTAFNENKLKSVDQFKYDNNFFNFGDPKVLKYLTKSTKRAWKKTYGFPYVSPITWDGKNIHPTNMTKCFKKCAHYVSSSSSMTI